MATLASRGTTVLGTSGTTWANTANAIDGTVGANTNSFATWTNATSAAVGYIEISGYHTAFAAIPAGSTITSVTIRLRHKESVTAPISTVNFQPYDGSTAIGTAFNCTLSTSNTNTDGTFTVTLAQLQSSNFKVRATATRAASGTSAIWSVDFLDVTVVYTPLLPKLETLTDDFSVGTTLNATKWPLVWTPAPTIVSGQAAIAYNNTWPGFGAADQGYTFVDSSVFAKLTLVAGDEAYMQIRCVADLETNMIQFWRKTTNFLFAQIKVAGAFETGANVNWAYDPVADLWWKITSAGTTITWFTSPDGVTWNQKAQKVGTTLNLASGHLFFYSGSSLAGTTYIDNVNVAPSGGTAYPVTGTAASTSATTGTLQAGLSLAGAAASTSATTGTPAAVHPLAGTAAATSATTGTPAAVHPLAGIATALTTTTGSPTAIHPLAGTVAATSAATGTIGSATPGVGYNLFSGTPSTPPYNDGQEISVGTEFYVTSSAWLTKVRYLSANTTPGYGARTMALYSVAAGGGSGTKVGGDWTLPDPVAGQWVSYTLPTPLALTSGTSYRIVVYHPDNGYTATGGYFSNGAGQTTTTIGGFLVRPNTTDAQGAAQGTYAYGTGGAGVVFPTGTFNGGCYYADVEVTNVNPVTSQSFSDDFNRADAGDLGFNWGWNYNEFSIVGNRAASESASSTFPVLWATPCATNDNFSQVTVATVGDTGSVGVICRWAASNGSLDTGYLWRSNGTALTLFAVVAGGFTNISADYPMTLTAGDVLKVSAVGSVVTGYINGVPVRRVVDTAVTSGKYVGLRANGTTLRMDDWSGGDTVTAPAAYSDDFNRANAATLGTNWWLDNTSVSIVSNQAAPNTGGTWETVWDMACTTDDNFSQMTLATIGNATTTGVMCRCDRDSINGYLWRYDPGGTEMVLFKQVSSGFTQIGAYTQALSNGAVLKVSAVGSTITGYIDGVARVTVTDTAVTTGRYGGIRSDGSTARLDNWYGGDGTGPAGGTAWPVTGTAAATSGTSGSISAVHPLVGTAAATSTTSGTLTRLNLALAAVTVAISATSGTIVAVHPLSGTAAATSATAGTLQAGFPLAGVAAATSTASGNPAAVHPLAGVSAAVSASSGTVNLVGGPQSYPLAGLAAATSATTGTIRAKFALAGTTVALTTTSGTINKVTGAQSYPLSGTAVAVSAATGTIELGVVAAGRPKVWTGSAWPSKPSGVWNGTAWVEKPWKTWTGSTWEAAT